MIQVLYGTSLDEERYNDTIRACGLLDDLEQLPGGDQTIIGGEVPHSNCARHIQLSCHCFDIVDISSWVRLTYAFRARHQYQWWAGTYSTIMQLCDAFHCISLNDLAFSLRS